MSNLVRGKDDPVAEPADFFPELPRSKPRVQSDSEQRALLDGLITELGGKRQTASVDKNAVAAEFEEAQRAFERARAGGADRVAG